MQRAFNTFLDFLQALDEFRSRVERYLVNFGSGIVPWFASLMPAYFAYIHLTVVLGVPKWLAFIFSGVIEVLGFASVSTFVDFWNLRKRYAQSTTKGTVSPYAPLGLLAVYLFVIIVVNGVLSFVDLVDIEILYDSVTSGDTRSIIVYLFAPLAKSFAIFMLSFMTIPGAGIIAIRTTQEQFLEEKGLAGRSKPKNAPETVSKPRESKSKPVSEKPKLTTKKRKFLQALVDDKRALQNKDALADRLGISRMSVYNYDNELRDVYYKVSPNNIVFDIKFE